MMSGPDPKSKDDEGHQRILERYTYRPPADTDSPAAKEMEVLTSYMKETHLQDVMSKLLGMLLSLTKLPYNPYPGFVRRLRAMAEKFHVFNTPPLPSSEEKIMETSIAGMYGLRGCDNIWGLKHMVSIMDGKAMKRYDWLVQDVTPREIVGMEEHSEYTGRILVALVGQAAFTGLLYENVDSIDIRIGICHIWP